MKIKILDSVECEISPQDGKKLIPCLSFKSSYWVQGPFKKTKKTYIKQVFSHKGKKAWYFHTGLLSRITTWCKENNITLEIVGEEIEIPRQVEPNLKGITFRDYQLKYINSVCKNQRGIIHGATGIGKTIMQLGIISCYPDYNTVILAHNTDIVKQTFGKAKEFGFKDIEMFGGGNRAKKPTKRIAISTMQTFVKINPAYYCDYYDIILLDESQHLQKMDSTYTEILNQMLAPIRIGFTATKRTTDEAVLVNEGLLGPTIERITIQEAAKLGILSTPKLKLIKAKCSDAIMDIRNFQDTYEKIRVKGKLVNGRRLKVGVYSFGIVENELRNRQIAEIVKDFITENKTVLIFVTHIKHGELIQKEIRKITNKETPFVRGDMPVNDREIIKNKLISKKIKVCIATTTWVEGVDIPSLDVVIIAGGGRSEVQTLQRPGRGLRKTDKKDTVIVIDFLDLKHFHLIRQTGERLAMYSDNDWL